MTDEEVYGLAEGEPEMEKQPAAGVVVGVRRIYRATDKEEIIVALTGSKLGVFREIWRLLIFSAQVGIRNNKREPVIGTDSGKGIDQSTFGNCPAWPGILYLIGLLETDDATILAGSPDAEEQRITAFQEYANGGLVLLEEFFSSRVVDLDGILAFVDSQIMKKDLTPDIDFTI